jgi:hypothetical protein
MKKQMPTGILLMVAMALLIPITALQAQIITYGGGRVSDRQMRSLLTRIETKTDTFRAEMARAVNQRAYNANREDRIENLIDQFEAATDTLRNEYDARRDVGTEVNNVLQRAAAIDRVMNRNNFGNRAENQWTSLRTDLDTLARFHKVAWNWNAYRGPDTNGGGFGRGSFDTRLTGTYRMNIPQSDNVQDVLERTFRNYSTGERQVFRPNLERRLTSPDMLAIEKTGNRVTLASTLAPQVTFNADGIARSEVNDNGRTMTTTAYADRSGLTIRYQGDRANDFNLMFTPLGNGQLRVVRTLYLENRNQTISVASVYDRVDSIARWSMVNAGDNYAGYPADRYGRFVVPNGTRLSARLDSYLSTRTSQVGDRFTMRVTSPYQYSGAVVQGHVASTTSSGRLSGRANLSLDFDSIRMPDGRTYDFAGFVESVRPVNGDTLSVDNEGAVRDNNQTTKAVTRAGIGAVIGAIVGAVAGGGKGAAIGATIGAGAGAGTVLIQGRDNIELEQGSEFVISASAPAGVGPIR